METIEKLATEIQKEINNTMEVCLFLAEKMINEPEHKYNKNDLLMNKLALLILCL